MSLKETKIYKRQRFYVHPEAEIDDKIRVAVTGDWHISPIITESQKYAIYQTILKIEPDLIVLQGDLVDSPTELFDHDSLKKLKDTLKLCSDSAPTVLVLGGHDFITPTDPGVELDVVPIWREICEETDVKLLQDEWFELENIRVFGCFQEADTVMDQDGHRKDNSRPFQEKLQSLDLKPKPDKINWFAAHAPNLTRKSIKALKDFDVISFGHTHGGCVPIGLDKLLDATHSNLGLISPELKPFPKTARGAKMLSTDTTLIINTGLVATHFSAAKPLQYLNPLKKGEITEVIFEPEVDPDNIEKSDEVEELEDF